MSEHGAELPANLPFEVRLPKYEWGQRVEAMTDLVNDGSYPDVAEGELLAGCGDVGEIVQIGIQTETNTPVYLVEFDGKRVVGCYEEEIGLLKGRE